VEDKRKATEEMERPDPGNLKIKLGKTKKCNPDDDDDDELCLLDRWFARHTVSQTHFNCIHYYVVTG